MLDLILEGLKNLLEAYAGQYGIIVLVVTWVGTLRLIFKPLMTAVESIIAATPSKDDDRRLEEIKNSTWYYWFVYLLDWFASIKLPAQTKSNRK